MRQDDGRVIPTFLTQALTGQDLSVYGDGTQTRSFLYVSDQVRGMRSFMSQPNLGGEVINIGSTDEITINKLAETMLSIVDTDSDIVYEPLPEGDPERRQPDISRAERLLDWGPSIDLETGIKKTLRDFESKLEV